MRELRGDVIKSLLGTLTLMLLVAPIALIFGFSTGVWWPFLAYAALIAVTGLWGLGWFLWEMRHFIGRQVHARRRRSELLKREMEG